VVWRGADAMMSSLLTALSVLAAIVFTAMLVMMVEVVETYGRR
jgi:hypothetical protein